MPFEALFFALRKAGIKLGLGDWMGVMEALSQGVTEPTIDDFYFVTRALVCKSENQFDVFDQAFVSVMKGVESFRSELEKLLDFLKDPKKARALLEMPEA